jgi:hypothetical protein
MGNIRSVQASPKYIHLHNQQGLIIWRTNRISVRITIIIHLCTSLRTSSNLVPTPDATPWRCRSKIIFILEVHWISYAFWPVSQKQSLRTVVQKQPTSDINMPLNYGFVDCFFYHMLYPVKIPSPMMQRPPLVSCKLTEKEEHIWALGKRKCNLAT